MFEIKVLCVLLLIGTVLLPVVTMGTPAQAREVAGDAAE
jgi:hypothetical protein